MERESGLPGRRIVLAATLVALSVMPGTAWAAPTVTVTNQADELTQNDGCSLREAIDVANADIDALGDCAVSEVSGPITIVLPAGHYNLTRGGAGENSNATGDLDVMHSMSINGAGAATATIDGQHADRVLEIFQGTVTIAGVTITSGQPKAGANGVNATDAGGDGEDGGGIRNVGTTTLRDSLVTLNNTRHGGDGSSAGGNGGAGGFGGRGGGVFNSGTGHLTLDRVVVTTNTTGLGGNGGMGGVAGNGGPAGAGGNGGGIYNDGNMTITGSTIAGSNTSGAGGNGGGSVTSGTTGGAGGEGGFGALVNSGTLTVADTTIANNLAGGGGFGGTGASGGGHGGKGGFGGGVYDVGTATFINATIANNSAGNGGDGGNNGAATGGDAGRGGGVVSHTATLTNATVAGNSIGTPGSGGTGGLSGTGGGIYALASGPTLRNTIVAANSSANCSAPGQSIVDGGHDLGFPDDGSCPGVHTDPKLGSLASNGGPTSTIALGAGSGALDQVPATGASCPLTDQRGTSRPQGPACEIGAFEVFVPPPPGGTLEGGSGAGGGLGGGGGAPVAVAALAGLKASPSAFPAASSGASIARRRKTGTTISYTDSLRATTTFTVLKPAVGTKSRGRCLKPRRGLRGRRCTRYVSVGSFTHADAAGRNSFHFTGRVRRRKLAPGAYRLQAVPRAIGINGRAGSIAFRIVR